MVDFDAIMASEWFTGDSPFGISCTPRNPKVCVITGANATGKSLLRKLIFNEYQDNKVHLMHFSQAARSRGGIHRAFLYGTEEEDSTGFNTTKTMLGAVRSASQQDKPYSMLFDEPEIGCSDELAAGLGFYLAGKLPTLWETHLQCCYIISHSRAFVREVMSLNPTHVHLMRDDHDYTSLRDWLDRPITPVYDLDAVVKRGKDGWSFIQGRIRENRRDK